MTWGGAHPLRWSGVLTAMVVVLAAQPHAAGDGTYVNAIKAYRAEQWRQAAALLEQARRTDPVENGRRIQISGNDVEEYHPSYYLADALAHVGDCVGAIEAWRVAEANAQRRSDKGMLSKVASARKRKSPNCIAPATTPAVPPNAPPAADPNWEPARRDAEAAQTEAETARRALMQAIAGAGTSEAARTATASLDQEVRTFEATNARLKQAGEQKNTSAMADAAKQFRTTTVQFRQIQQLLQAALTEADTRFEAATWTAQTVINEAAEAEKKAVAAEAPATALRNARSQLQNARTELEEGGKTRAMDRLQNAARLAAASRDAFRSAETAAAGHTQSAWRNAGGALAQAQNASKRLEDLLAGREANAEVRQARESLARATQRLSGASASSSEIATATTEATTAEQIFERAAQPLLASIVQAIQVALDTSERDLERVDGLLKTSDAQPRPNEIQLASGIRRRVTSARAQFNQQRTTQDPTTVIALQRTANEARDQIAQLARSLESRLAVATGVPQELMSGARDFFSGKYQLARENLGRVRIEDKTPAIRLQVWLFRAASLYALYIVAGERDDTLKSAATAALQECRRLNPAYAPDDRIFSPRFLKFFRNGS